MYSKIIALAAILGNVSAVQIRAMDNSDPLGRNVDKTTW